MSWPGSVASGTTAWLPDTSTSELDDARDAVDRNERKTFTASQAHVIERYSD